MRLGVVLPTFAWDGAPALAAAEQAEAAGLDGVFCYDHLWPLGEPGRPALAPFPVLGALAGRTSAIVLGTLVARVGLVPDDVLAAEFATLAEICGGRVVAGIGTGDRLSVAENDAYGIATPPARERRARCAALARRLVAEGLPTWVGGRSAGAAALARDSGAALNLWSTPPEEVRADGAGGEVTWGGLLPAEPAAAAARVRALADAGASWAVFQWPGAATPLLAAAREAGLR